MNLGKIKNLDKMKCCVPLCEATGDSYPPTVLDNQDQVLFHELPKTAWLRKSWLVTIGLKACNLPENAVVCSQHFVKDDYTVSYYGVKRLRNNSVPSVFKVPIAQATNFDYCMICLETDVSKLFLLHWNRLAKAFTNVTGLELRALRDYVKTFPKLCTECAQRLTNCNAFKEKSLRAQSILKQIFEKDKVITLQRLKSVNRVGNLLLSNLVKHTFEPDHCDLHLIHDEQNNNTKKEKNISNIEGNIDNVHKEENNLKANSDLISEKSESEKDATDYEVEYLSELDDANNAVQSVINNQRHQKNTGVTNNHFQVNNNTLNNDDIKNAPISSCSDQINEYRFDDDDRLYDDDIRKADKITKADNIINLDESDDSVIYDDSVNSKPANNNGDLFMNCDSDCEAEFLDLDMDNIDDGIDNDIDSDIDDYDIDDDGEPDETNKLSNNKNSYIDDDGKLDETNKLLNNKNSNDRLLNFKVGTENKVSLNNLIFVKDTRPVIQHKDSIPGNDVTHQNLSKTNENASNTIVMRRRMTQNSSSCQEHIEHENEDKLKVKNNKKLRTTKCNTKKKRISAPKRSKKVKAMKRVSKKLRVWAQKNSNKKTADVQRPKPKVWTDADVKTFTRTTLNYEEQIADVQKKKCSEKYIKARYKCDICFEGFKKLSAHTYHMHKHTNKFGPFECGICGVHCRRRITLTRHVLTHSVKFSCKQCPFTTNTKNTAQDHERAHEGKTFKCKHCEAEFCSKSGYFLHKRLKHSSDHTCALCGENFAGPFGVKVHTYLRHPFEDVQNLSGPTCEECNIRFASDAAYQRHKKVSPKHAVGGRPDFRTRPFKTSWIYKSVGHRRVKKAHGTGPRKPGDKYLCEVCGKAFTNSVYIREHMSVHTGEKLYKCEECGKRFGYHVSYKSHLLLHGANPQRYPCGVCHKDFSSLSNRKKHMKKHLANRSDHKCGICDKTFLSNEGLTQHTQHVHLNVPWPKRNRRDRYTRKTRTDHASATQQSDMDRED